MSCECHGRGVVEVKCPFSFKDKLPEDNIKGFCMEKVDVWSLQHDHAYYYQVQLQMRVCKVSYCHFIVWSKSGQINQLIPFNEDFVQSIKMKSLTFSSMPFYLNCWENGILENQFLTTMAHSIFLVISPLVKQAQELAIITSYITGSLHLLKLLAPTFIGSLGFGMGCHHSI